MFKIGGSAGTGITSGLDQPRQNYRTAGSVAPVPRDALTKRAESLKDAAMSVFLEGARNRGQFTDDTPSNNMQLTGDTAVGGGTSLEDAIAIARAKADRDWETYPI